MCYKAIQSWGEKVMIGGQQIDAELIFMQAEGPGREPEEGEIV